MLAENKFSKPASPTGMYLNYAVGEIILVVIGILIAVQIKNWNEDQKATNREKIILKKFRTSIDQDILN